MTLFLLAVHFIPSVFRRTKNRIRTADRNFGVEMKANKPHITRNFLVMMHVQDLHLGRHFVYKTYFGEDKKNLVQ